MKDRPFVGVWLDHRRALMFWANGQAEARIVEVESGYQEEGEPIDSVRAAAQVGHAGAVPHANLDSRRREQLKHFYKELDQRLRDAQEIFLFGPGQAKRELASLIRKDKGSRAQLKAVESTDKRMTQPQMMARIREFCSLPREAV